VPRTYQRRSAAWAGEALLYGRRTRTSPGGAVCTACRVVHPRYGDDPAVFFEPAECDELDLRVVARLEPRWGQLGTDQAESAVPAAPISAALAEGTAPPPPSPPPPQQQQLLWSFGVAFTRRLGDWEDFESDPGLSETTEALGSREALYELSRLDWT